MRRQWKIIPRPLLETVLNNHAGHPRVANPLILHGPRGVGKKTLIVHRLLDSWNRPPHVTAYVDFSRQNDPWLLEAGSVSIGDLRLQLEQSLESLAQKAVRLGCIGGNDVLSTLKKWHGIDGALRQILGKTDVSGKDSTAVLWRKAIRAVSSRGVVGDWEEQYREHLTELGAWNDALQPGSGGVHARNVELLGTGKLDLKSMEELSYFKEAVLSLHLAKEVLSVHERWRAKAVETSNRTGEYSNSLANLSTNWPLLLLDLLSAAAHMGYFQPKLVMNNIDVLRKANLAGSCPMVPAALYHDSLLWRLIALGVNERFLPIMLVTSDGYYSYQVFRDFGYSELFISRETFGWTPKEAKMHMVTDFFSEAEWKTIIDVVGSNHRHLSDLFTLKEAIYESKTLKTIKDGDFDDTVDLYLSYLQVTVVNRGIEAALLILERFALDAYSGKISKDILCFGSPWRHPPRADNNLDRLQWAKLQMMDFIQSLVNAEFGVNYLGENSFEILEDPCVTALMEVGLLYTQRDPSYIRPVSRAIQRCFVRWLVQERMQMSLKQAFLFKWHRIIRGRSYRHLMRK
ncbi:hypothetical protein EJ110_NYTH14565 [Nymphaea thermarum]|nr:hypothetical protein EJ110_NYTH14565 [Nymphaea thermarum]